MNRALIIIYLIFFIGFIVPVGTSDDIKQGYPLWITISGVIVPVLGALSILLYALSFEPKRCAWFWKIVPILLVVYYAIAWWFDFILYKEPDNNITLIAVATFVGLLLLCPAFYFSFKFGYSEDRP